MPIYAISYFFNLFIWVKSAPAHPLIDNESVAAKIKKAINTLLVINYIKTKPEKKPNFKLLPTH